MTETIKRTIHKYDSNGKLVKEIIEEIIKEDNSCAISGYITNKPVPSIYNGKINELNTGSKSISGSFTRVQNEESRVTWEGR